MNGFPAICLSEFALDVNRLIGKAPQKEKPIALYGLYDASNRCHYIGQTINVYKRAMEHARKHVTFPHPFAKGNYLFRVLRWCARAEASRLEIQLIRAYKKRGECNLNKNITGRGGPTWGQRLVWVERGKYFESYADAGREFDCCGATIRNWVRKGSWMAGVTLKEI